MKVYLFSNNLLLEGLKYVINDDLDLVRITRPLSIEGDNLDKELSSDNIFNDIEKIYTSFYASSIITPKYLANKLDLNINLLDKLNKYKFGIIVNKNMKMVKGLQENEFSYKLPIGES